MDVSDCETSLYSALSDHSPEHEQPRSRQNPYHLLPRYLIVLTLHRFPNNARLDSLDDWWRPVFGITHGVLVLDGFRENVKVHDMQGRELKEGERPENVVLQFNPKDATSMLVPCIWSR